MKERNRAYRRWAKFRKRRYAERIVLDIWQWHYRWVYTFEWKDGMVVDRDTGELKPGKVFCRRLLTRAESDARLEDHRKMAHRMAENMTQYSDPYDWDFGRGIRRQTARSNEEWEQIQRELSYGEDDSIPRAKADEAGATGEDEAEAE